MKQSIISVRERERERERESRIHMSKEGDAELSLAAGTVAAVATTRAVRGKAVEACHFNVE